MLVFGVVFFLFVHIYSSKYIIFRRWKTTVSSILIAIAIENLDHDLWIFAKLGWNVVNDLKEGVIYALNDINLVE